MDAKQAQGDGSATNTTALRNPSDGDRPNGHLVLDPDEDELDDLDDLLDEFSTAQDDVHRNEPAASTSIPHESAVAQETPDVATDEFSKQLQEQMAALLGSVDETPEMKKEMEAMLRELGAAADPGVTADLDRKNDGQPTSNAGSVGREDPFQETIRKTMERMQNSGDQATAAANSNDTDEVMAQLLKEMQAGGGADGEEDFSKMLLSMMEQLTNKEILYEPMKELHDKFPAWMMKNKETTKADDLSRYEKQQHLVSDIVRKFEEKGYADSRAADREYIVERMQKMQAAGSPPADLVGDLNGAQDALGNLDAGCPQQ